MRGMTLSWGWLDHIGKQLTLGVLLILLSLGVITALPALAGACAAQREPPGGTSATIWHTFRKTFRPLLPLSALFAAWLAVAAADLLFILNVPNPAGAGAVSAALAFISAMVIAVVLWVPKNADRSTTRRVLTAARTDISRDPIRTLLGLTAIISCSIAGIAIPLIAPICAALVSWCVVKVTRMDEVQHQARSTKTS